MKVLKKKTTRLAIILLFMAAVTAVSISYFGDKEEAAVVVPDNAQAGDLTVEPCLIEIESDTYDADCGTVIVWESG